ncbi:peptide/nickel transport system ATP-binding protein [Saccharopolyspora lacisalsi]|uniref:Peptide/nickel transport system ATP-binding protein n=1 Tax=Halosaccharopolyspora lacisalsi TaxID=1000566 RepID=A0A839DYC3_9PSEU|nr:ABC transporter ATP-binding protein [Halosaccharopolyspora lacisalsi]MBA8824355.1 peptide/nickel transport system ATP-binding protein [Halosaccharopolyspora lacisalsi]
MVTGSDSDAEPLMSVRDLNTHFTTGRNLLGRTQGVVKAVDGVNFELHRGEVLGLVGESGSGKSTLGRSLLKLVQPTSGEIRYQGRDLVPMSESQMRPMRRELSMIFQDPNASMNPAMTIAQGVGHPLWIHGMVETRAEAREWVVDMLERVGLQPARNYLDRYPEELSGGQKQRLVIARSLITKPSFVIADEPVAALDMSVRARVLELMLELQEELDLTYVFITHDLATARFMCDRIGILYLGRFVEYGDADLMFSDPQHPYTRALLSAIPQPEAGRRGREKTLPRGEIPDAARPPAGCRFHPRCPQAFEVCGWEGQDLIDALEERWTQVDPETYERETKLFGKLDNAEVARESVRFSASAPEDLAEWLHEHGPNLHANVFSAVTEVRVESSHVLVRFGAGPEPAMQKVDRRDVACHLHGVLVRESGVHVGGPEVLHQTAR